jgi:hypothetical protein
MNDPNGFVTARMIRKNNAICASPSPVISMLLQNFSGRNSA